MQFMTNAKNTLTEENKRVVKTVLAKQKWHNKTAGEPTKSTMGVEGLTMVHTNILHLNVVNPQHSNK